MRFPALLLATLFLTGCATNASKASVEPGQPPIVNEFQKRVEAFARTREEVAKSLNSGASGTATQVEANRAALTAGVQARRLGAKYGDIFTPEVRQYVRGVLAPPLAGTEGRAVRADAADDSPAPGAVILEVNRVYPSSTPFASTPTTVLAALPRLPAGMEYRLIGRDLVLIDQPTHLIVDYMHNALPAASR